MTLSLERVKRRCEVISPAHHPLLIPAATEAAPFISFPVKLEKSPEGFSELLGRGTLRRMTTANDICNAVLGGLQRDYEAVHRRGEVEQEKAEKMRAIETHEVVVVEEEEEEEVADFDSSVEEEASRQDPPQRQPPSPLSKEAQKSVLAIMQKMEMPSSTDLKSVDKMVKSALERIDCK